MVAGMQVIAASAITTNVEVVMGKTSNRLSLVANTAMTGLSEK
jgi:hypothetical protein